MVNAANESSEPIVLKNSAGSKTALENRNAFLVRALWGTLFLLGASFGSPGVAGTRHAR